MAQRWALSDALKRNGAVKCCFSYYLSGKSANFFGWRNPNSRPTASGMGTNVTIDYKPFGVGLTFTPIVLNSKRSIYRLLEVQNLIYKCSELSGFTVPSFSTRRVSTTIELDDGQSFVIAGLLQDDTRKIISKYPLLGDIPVLGAVFRSTSWQRNETELIVIATPRLVKPVDMTKQPLPTDKYSDPNDFEFYLNGKSEGSGREPTEPIK
jgi:pilus assembly protein CpaC